MRTSPPSHDKRREIAQTGAEMIASLVPVVGGTIAVALAAALGHTLNKRRESWFTELAEAVEELRDRFDGFDPESLADNDAFVDAVMTATRIVDRTSQREKTNLLRNAALNSAMPGAPDLDIQQLYLALVDDLSPTHMRLLSVLHDPSGWFDRTGLPRPQFALSSSRPALIEAAMPDLAAKGPQMVERFYAALTGGGLVNGSLAGMMTASGAWQPVTTDFANGFLDFVDDPR